MHAVIHTYMDWTLHEKAQPSSSSDCIKLSRRTAFGTSFAGKKPGCLGETVSQSNLGLFCDKLNFCTLLRTFSNKETGKTTQTRRHSIFLAYQPPPRAAASARSGQRRGRGSHGWGEAERPLARWNFASTPPDHRRTRTTTKTHAKKTKCKKRTGSNLKPPKDSGWS